MKVIIEKKNSSFAKMKSYLDTRLRVVHEVQIEGEGMGFLGRFSQLRIILGPLSTSPKRMQGGISEIIGLQI